MSVKRRIVVVSIVAAVLSVLVLGRLDRFAHANSSAANSFGLPVTVSCPQSINVGVVDVPTGWADYNKRALPFENLRIVNTAQGSGVICDYGNGEFALNRMMPGRFCERLGERSPAVSCRTFPTKR